ncbi:hypothetical protein ACFS27_03190 [Promicromonospora vindobonensis]|uniref:Uncharacterized protein n=1 Tax=Promicromonospora vindobonensis TaxID=195748 RepID=A0ABW5VQ92_9MICO
MSTNDLTGVLACEPYGFHPAEPPEGPPHDLPQREVGATLTPEDQAQLITNREHMRAAYERETNR